GQLECVNGGCCLPATYACQGSSCCAGLVCGNTTLGRVCSGNAGASCTRADGADCCGALRCVNKLCRSRPVEPGGRRRRRTAWYRSELSIVCLLKRLSGDYNSGAFHVHEGRMNRCPVFAARAHGACWGGAVAAVLLGG